MASPRKAASVYKLCLYGLLLTVWAGFVVIFVTPATLFCSAVVAAVLLFRPLPVIPLKKTDTERLSWWETMLFPLICDINIRTPLVVAFVLPASLVFDLFFYFRTQYIQTSSTHEEKVQRAVEQVQAWKKSGSKKKLCTARAGWLTISPKRSTYKDQSHQISLEMYEVLELDEEAMTVRVEPGVNMAKLSHFLLSKGYSVPVLPEMDDLTVGGLINGCGVEVSSHKYGMFQHICVAYELLLPDGNVKCVDATNDADIFFAIPWSYGSIGLLLSATLKVIKAKPFVKITYTPTHSEEEFVSRFESASTSESPPEFVEGLVFGEHKACLIQGDFVDQSEVKLWSTLTPVNHLHRYYKPWFAWYVDDIEATRVEYMPTRAWYHRHTRSIFWELQDMLPAEFGNHWLFRLLLGWAVPPKVAFLKLIQPEAMRQWYEKQHVIQDMLVPLSTMAQSLKVFRDHYDVYPLWVCPMKIPAGIPGMISPATTTAAGGQTRTEEMFVDLGAYGIPSAAREGRFDAERSGLGVEQFVRDVQGFQMMYADTHMDEGEFRTMFDHTLLDKARKSVGAVGAFPEPFEKVCKRRQRKDKGQ